MSMVDVGIVGVPVHEGTVLMNVDVPLPSSSARRVWVRMVLIVHMRMLVHHLLVTVLVLFE
jgi:hypothetical protein